MTILPDDILEELLFQYLKCIWYEPLPLIRARATLCEVCARWKSIITHSPRFWSTIYLISRSMAIPMPSLDLVRQWITRAQQMPLSIYIFINIYDRSHTIEAIDHLTLLASYLRQWKHFTLNVKGSRTPLIDIASFLDGFSFEEAIQLQSASFHLMHGPEPPGSIIRKIGRFPSFRSLGWPGCSARNANVILNHVNIAVLTSLSLTGEYLSPFVPILQGAVSLRHLKIHTFVKSGLGTVSPIILPQLEFLFLGNNFRPCHLLDALEAPKLKVLAIRIMAPFSRRSQLDPILNKYLSSAPPCLRTLTVHTSPTSGFYKDLLTHPVISNFTILQIIHTTHTPDVTRHQAIWRDNMKDTNIPDMIVERVTFRCEDEQPRPPYTLIAGWAGHDEFKAFERTPSMLIDSSFGEVLDDHGDRWKCALLTMELEE